MSRDRRIAITVAAAVLYLLFAAPWAGLGRSGRRVDTVHSGLVFTPSSTAYIGYELAMGQLFLELAVVCVVVAMAAPSTVSFIKKITGSNWPP